MQCKQYMIMPRCQATNCNNVMWRSRILWLGTIIHSLYYTHAYIYIYINLSRINRTTIGVYIYIYIYIYYIYIILGKTLNRKTFPFWRVAFSFHSDWTVPIVNVIADLKFGSCNTFSSRFMPRWIKKLNIYTFLRFRVHFKVHSAHVGQVIEHKKVLLIVHLEVDLRL